jgi:hypothetical protein
MPHQRKLDSKVVSLEKTFETTIDNLLVGTQAVLGFIPYLSQTCAPHVSATPDSNLYV